MISTKSKPQAAVIGAAGEHLVLSNLLRQGLVAGEAPQNTKDFDLIVLSEDGTSSSPVQVKTTMSKSGWIMKEKHETPIEGLIFCFVYLEKDSSDSEIFVIDSETVGHVIKNSHSIWLKLPNKQGGPHKDTNMRYLSRYPFKTYMKQLDNYEQYLAKGDLQFLNKYASGEWLSEYKDAWHSIHK